MTPAKRILDANDAYPLRWPSGWPRTNTRQTTTRYKVPFSEARDDVLGELGRLGAVECVISSNLPLRLDGFPRADVADPYVADPGIAVYWVTLARDASRTQQHRAIACDRYTRARDNLRACGMAIGALRTLQRSGATQVIDRVFGGFAALPANAGSGRAWRDVLGFAPTDVVGESAVRQRYLELIARAHPDKPEGSHERAVEIGAALASAIREVRQ